MTDTAKTTAGQARQPLNREQRDLVAEHAAAEMELDANLSWRNAIITEVERAHGIGVGPVLAQPRLAQMQAERSELRELVSARAVIEQCRAGCMRLSASCALGR